MTFDYRLITDIEIEDIDTNDYPDFCDAYISAAYYDGVPMTEQQLELLNQDSTFVYDSIIEKIF